MFEYQAATDNASATTTISTYKTYLHFLFSCSELFLKVSLCLSKKIQGLYLTKGFDIVSPFSKIYLNSIKRIYFFNLTNILLLQQ